MTQLDIFGKPEAAESKEAPSSNYEAALDTTGLPLKTKGKSARGKETMPKTLDFEATLTALEKIVGELDGEVKLERALSLFEEGMKLSADCQKFLQAADKQVEILKKNADGTLTTLPFSEDPLA